MRGELRPGGTQREWCDPEVLRRLRRASLAALRAEIEPADQRAFARFQASLAGRRPPPAGRRGRSTACARSSSRSRGSPLPLEVWERDVLPRRTGAYSPALAGSAVRVGRDRVGRRGRARPPLGPRRAVLPRRRAADRPAAEAAPSRRREPVHEAVRERLQAGPCFFTDLLTDVTGFPTEELQNALWDLVWAGEATNDAFAPLRSPKLTADAVVVAAGARGAPAHVRLAPARRRAARRPGPLVADARRCSARTTIPSARRRTQAELLLERYGIVTREQVLAEGIPGGFSSALRLAAALETIGIARRGYFVEGLGGAQFALPGRGRAPARAEGRRRRAAARARRHRPRPALRRRR